MGKRSRKQTLTDPKAKQHTAFVVSNSTSLTDGRQPGWAFQETRLEERAEPNGFCEQHQHHSSSRLKTNPYNKPGMIDGVLSKHSKPSAAMEDAARLSCTPREGGRWK